jgi:hypothetical protein
MKSYEQWKLEQEHGYIDTDNIQLKKVKIDNNELKTSLFKLAVVKLMLEYDLCISHEDEHGAFKIIPYNQDKVEWFVESEFNKK